MNPAVKQTASARQRLGSGAASGLVWVIRVILPISHDVAAVAPRVGFVESRVECDKLDHVNFEASSSKKPAEVARMFDYAAPSYDLMNALLSIGQDAHWRDATTAALDAKPGERVLDLAAGTGASSAPLLHAGADVFSLDRSEGMVAVGRARHPEIVFSVGDGEALPFADGAFDAVTVSFGLRNMTHPVAVLRELARVTAAGGRLIICEFSRPTPLWLRAAYYGWLRLVMPLASILSRNPASYHYLAQSILEWPNQKVVAGWLRSAGWHDVAYRNLSGGIVALHRGTR